MRSRAGYGILHEPGRGRTLGRAALPGYVKCRGAFGNGSPRTFYGLNGAENGLV